jgi:hypothetical protein
MALAASRKPRLQKTPLRNESFRVVRAITRTIHNPTLSL